MENQLTVRPIKFRAWDEVNKRFSRAPVYINQEGETLMDCDPNGIQMSGKRSIMHKEYVIQQFTGFKDSKGQEIYEGDVFEPEDGEDFSGFVKWEDGRWCINWGGKYSDPCTDYHMDAFKVIGNIYENPEILSF